MIKALKKSGVQLLLLLVVITSVLMTGCSSEGDTPEVAKEGLVKINLSSGVGIQNIGEEINLSSYRITIIKDGNELASQELASINETANFKLRAGDYQVVAEAIETIDGNDYVAYKGSETLKVSSEGVTSKTITLKLQDGDVKVNISITGEWVPSNQSKVIISYPRRDVYEQFIDLSEGTAIANFKGIPARKWDIVVQVGEDSVKKEGIYILPDRVNIFGFNVSQTESGISIDVENGPAQVTGLTASLDSNGDVKLVWDLVEDAAYYFIYRSTESEVTTAKRIADTETTEYVDTILGDGTYYYWVEAYNANGLASKMSSAVEISVTKPEATLDDAKAFVTNLRQHGVNLQQAGQAQAEKIETNLKADVIPYLVAMGYRLERVKDVLKAHGILVDQRRGYGPGTYTVDLTQLEAFEDIYWGELENYFNDFNDYWDEFYANTFYDQNNWVEGEYEAYKDYYISNYTQYNSFVEYVETQTGFIANKAPVTNPQELAEWNWVINFVNSDEQVTITMNNLEDVESREVVELEKYDHYEIEKFDFTKADFTYKHTSAIDENFDWSFDFTVDAEETETIVGIDEWVNDYYWASVYYEDPETGYGSSYQIKELWKEIAQSGPGDYVIDLAKYAKYQEIKYYQDISEDAYPGDYIEDYWQYEQDFYNDTVKYDQYAGDYEAYYFAEHSQYANFADYVMDLKAQIEEIKANIVVASTPIINPEELDKWEWNISFVNNNESYTVVRDNTGYVPEYGEYDEPEIIIIESKEGYEYYTTIPTKGSIKVLGTMTDSQTLSDENNIFAELYEEEVPTEIPPIGTINLDASLTLDLKQDDQTPNQFVSYQGQFASEAFSYNGNANINFINVPSYQEVHDRKGVGVLVDNMNFEGVLSTAVFKLTGSTKADFVKKEVRFEDGEYQIISLPDIVNFAGSYEDISVEEGFRFDGSLTLDLDYNDFNIDLTAWDFENKFNYLPGTVTLTGDLVNTGYEDVHLIVKIMRDGYQHLTSDFKYSFGSKYIAGVAKYGAEEPFHLEAYSEQGLNLNFKDYADELKLGEIRSNKGTLYGEIISSDGLPQVNFSDGEIISLVPEQSDLQTQ
ncbi:hypothetical protein BX659_10266 [Orenia metallireducens]|uniref:Fibronectin type-III domain-containing protein n=1 Tax=Orenia metallireducens TaxID=1413210 RepID=A0A285F2I5_9FIRM|nr:hypothetical protein [Orenia metallireducens]PRX34751.1 hypothetical protein BX659_10266 [Orenia metallireducens]SNY05482.1 hypothetical protein SAMN06265827_10166 [Orenia metallireducens]